MSKIGGGRGEEHCCPRFDPAPWQERLHTWNEKRFIKETIPEFLHMPLPGTFQRAVSSLWRKAQEADAAPQAAEALFLAHDPSPWISEIYLSVIKEVPGSCNIRFTGSYYSRVFDGPYNAVPRYLREMEASLAKKGWRAKRHLFHFTTCPRCARSYGHNYILALAELAEP